MARKYRNVLSLAAFCAAVVIALYSAWRARQDTKIELARQRELNEVISAVLDSSDVGYAIADENGRFIEWNPALERLTGWTEEEVTKQGIRQMMYGDAMDRHFAAFTKAMKSPIDRTKVSVVYCQLPQKDKTKPDIPVRVSVRVVEADSGRKFAVAHVDKQDDIRVFRQKPDDERIVK